MPFTSMWLPAQGAHYEEVPLLVISKTSVVDHGEGAYPWACLQHVHSLQTNQNICARSLSLFRKWKHGGFTCMGLVIQGNEGDFPCSIPALLQTPSPHSVPLNSGLTCRRTKINFKVWFCLISWSIQFFPLTCILSPIYIIICMWTKHSKKAALMCLSMWFIKNLLLCHVQTTVIATALYRPKSIDPTSFVRCMCGFFLTCTCPPMYQQSTI